MAESCDDCCDPIFSRSGLIDAHINVHFYFRKCRTIAHYRSRSRSRTRCRTSSQLSRTICQLLVITLDIYRKRDDDDAPRVLQLQQSCDKLNLLCHGAFGRVGKSLGRWSFSWSLGGWPDKRHRYELREYESYPQNTFGRLIDFNMRRDERIAISHASSSSSTYIIIVIHKSYAPYLASVESFGICWSSDLCG